MSKKTDDEKEAKVTEAAPKAERPHDPTTAPRGQTPTIGRIVHYRLTSNDVDDIHRRRDGKSRNWGDVHQGAQAHVGGGVAEGGVVAMIITHPDNGGAINGQCILDGNDSLWVTGVEEGTDPGTWSWPPRS